MTATWILGLLAAIGAAVFHALNMKKVWWAPRFGVGVQFIWIAYGLSSWNTFPMFLIALWYLGWCLWAWPKWKKER